jgi:hypothetical protein
VPTTRLHTYLIISKPSSIFLLLNNIAIVEALIPEIMAVKKMIGILCELIRIDLWAADKRTANPDEKEKNNNKKESKYSERVELPPLY